MKAQLILGNQLFDPKVYLKHLDKNSVVFMREDNELCTHYKYHKHKIIFFLSAMRKYADELGESGFKVYYEKLNEKPDLTFDESLFQFFKKNKIQELCVFEIEDKFFETRVLVLCQKQKIKLTILNSPMFLTSRDEFKTYLGKSKKPFMKSFYEGQRKRLKILIKDDGTPVGDKWSFDEDNRKPLLKDFVASELPQFIADDIDKSIYSLVEDNFSKHPGQIDNYWLPTDRKAAKKWLKSFINERLRDFGPYEDAMTEKFDFVNHSVLTPYLNTGLLSPREVVSEVLKFAKSEKIPMNSTEGFIRQVIGWREFIRGIYQNFSEKQDSTNFWNHQRKLTAHWYKGTTGIAPLDHVIKKTQRLGYAHHIERLMVVGSLMLLLEVHPEQAHKWFMEMFIDSSDWVMGPNVYGMAIFSDGGIFATKPYFCGSNYYKKMGGYKSGDWQDAVDGLYWGFIEKHMAFFLKNPRLSMMARTVEKMSPEKKAKIYKAAQQLKDRITS